MRGRSTCWYNGLSEGRFPAAAPPAFLLSDEVTTAALHPELTALCEAGESGSWWREDGSFASMFKNALSDQNFAIVDGLWDAEATERVRGECEAAYSQGLLSPATVTTAGDTGKGAISDTRRDHAAWIDIAQGPEEWASLSQLVSDIDAVVKGLGVGTTARMRPMISRYGPGAFFARHCDNHCDQGVGPLCNGRALTAIFYVNAGWREYDGGCLRVYRPQGPDDDDGLHEESEACASPEAKEAAVREMVRATDNDVVADVAPLAGRLVVFFSDYRVPHEVLPVTVEAKADRFAVTIWYTDGEGYPEAQS